MSNTNAPQKQPIPDWFLDELHDHADAYYSEEDYKQDFIAGAEWGFEKAVSKLSQTAAPGMRHQDLVEFVTWLIEMHIIRPEITLPFKPDADYIATRYEKEHLQISSPAVPSKPEEQAPPIVTIRVKTAREGCWYANLVGEYFEVYDYGKNWVVAKDYDLGHNAMWRHIEKEDAFIADTNIEQAPPIPGGEESKDVTPDVSSERQQEIDGFINTLESMKEKWEQQDSLPAAPPHAEEKESGPDLRETINFLSKQAMRNRDNAEDNAEECYYEGMVVALAELKKEMGLPPLLPSLDRQREPSPEDKAIAELAARQTSLDPDMQAVLNRTSERLSIPAPSDNSVVEEERIGWDEFGRPMPLFYNNLPEELRHFIFQTSRLYSQTAETVASRNGAILMYHKMQGEITLKKIELNSQSCIIDDLKAELAAITAERDEYRKRIEVFRDEAATKVKKFRNADTDDEISELRYYHGQQVALNQILLWLGHSPQNTTQQ